MPSARERGLLCEEEVVQLRARLPADSNGVLKSCRGYERNTRAFAFQKRVRANCCAMTDIGRLAGRNPIDSVQDGETGIFGCRRHFEDTQLAVRKKHAIGEGSAGIDSDSHVSRGAPILFSMASQRFSMACRCG